MLSFFISRKVSLGFLDYPKYSFGGGRCLNESHIYILPIVCMYKSVKLGVRGLSIVNKVLIGKKRIKTRSKVLINE